ncbi:MAG: hypothetical protein AB1442_05610 [Nitrospirota bacterium]
MGKDEPESDRQVEFTKDNPDNIKKVLARYKNILIRGVWGVGKITNTIKALQNNSEVYYVGNPVDFEGKGRPGSYEKYLTYISSLKKDMTMVEDIQSLFKMDQKITLIIDEIYGRSDAQLEQIEKLLDKKNIQIVQIVGCMKNMRTLIDKIDIVIDLHHGGAIVVDKDLAKAICRIFGMKPQVRA